MAKDEEMEKLKSEMEKLKAEKEILELKKAKKDAEKALEGPSEIDKIKQYVKDLKEILPGSDVKPLEGKITVDENSSMECQILAYKAMSEIAFQICKDINNLKTARPKGVIIYSREELNATLAYKIFAQQTRFLNDEYEKIVKLQPIIKAILPAAPVVAGISAIPAVSKAVIDVISLFRKNIEIKGKKIEIDNEALIAEVARALNSVRITTINPPFVNEVPDKMHILNEISKLYTLKEKIDQKIKELSEEKAPSDNLAVLKGLSEQCKKVITYIEGTDEKSKVERLETLIKGEILSKELDKGDVDILYLKVIFSGGNNKTIQSLFSSGQLSHIGGAIITYFLLSKKGDIKASKTFYNSTGYKKFKYSEDAAKLNNF